MADMDVTVGIHAEDNFSHAFNEVESFFADIPKHAKTFTDEIGKQAEAFFSLQGAAKTLSKSFATLFESWADGTASGSQNWETFLTSITSSIPIVGGAISSLLDRWIETDEEKRGKVLANLKSELKALTAENRVEEAARIASLGKDERDRDLDLHRMRVEHLEEEAALKRALGEETAREEEAILRERARFQEALIAREQALLEEARASAKEGFDYDMNQFRFLTGMKDGALDENYEQVDYLKRTLASLTQTYGLGDVRTMSKETYLSLDDHRRDAVDRARGILLDLADLSGSTDASASRGGDAKPRYDATPTATPTVYNVSVAVANDFSNAFITDTPREFYTNRFEGLVRETIQNEVLTYG